MVSIHCTKRLNIPQFKLVTHLGDPFPLQELNVGDPYVLNDSLVSHAFTLVSHGFIV